MATTGLVQFRRFRYHDTGPGHPERSERLVRLEQEFAGNGLAAACQPVEVLEIDLGLVLKVHAFDYVDRIRLACQQGMPFIDTPDSAICPESYVIAVLAAGSVISAVNDVMTGAVKNAFCLVRPPGHHAERDRSMGFCLLNNVAIAAHHLFGHYGLERVLILDWDVHHGNGTQHAFEADPRVLYVSLHGHPHTLYPGTGFEEEVGVGPGEGYTVNCPLGPGAGDAEYRRAFTERIMPAVEKYEPQFVLLSAGFDAHRLDPLAPMLLETESFGWMTELMLDVARRYAGGRLVSVLEGGYHLDALAESAGLHVKRLLEA